MSATLDDVLVVMSELRRTVSGMADTIEELKDQSVGKSWRAGDVLEAEDVLKELKVGKDKLATMVKNRIIIPLPRKMPEGKGRGKRGGKLRFLFEEVQRAKGVRERTLGADL